MTLSAGVQRPSAAEPGPRYALYYTAPSDSPLHAFGSTVLGYDAYTGERVARPTWLSEIVPDAEPARRYGFHATVKAPMHLTVPEEELLAATTRFAEGRTPVVIGPLAVASVDGFVALTPRDAPASLALLAAECVASFDGFRAALSDAERRRRGPDLPRRQRALLERWGYPYIFEQFRFHMTLTGRLNDPERGEALRGLADAYRHLSKTDVVIDALSVLRQDAATSDFRVIARMPFQG